MAGPSGVSLRWALVKPPWAIAILASKIAKDRAIAIGTRRFIG